LVIREMPVFWKVSGGSIYQAKGEGGGRVMGESREWYKKKPEKKGRTRRSITKV